MFRRPPRSHVDLACTHNENHLLCPAPRFPAFTSPDPRLPNSKFVPAPLRLKRELDAQIKRQQSKEVNGMRDDGVDMVRGVPYITVNTRARKLTATYAECPPGRAKSSPRSSTLLWSPPCPQSEDVPPLRRHETLRRVPVRGQNAHAPAPSTTHAVLVSPWPSDYPAGVRGRDVRPRASADATRGIRVADVVVRVLQNVRKTATRGTRGTHWRHCPA